MHSHEVKSQLAKRGMHSTLVGIIANAVLAIVKAIAGVMGNSYALVADAIESSADVLSSFIVWFGLKIAAAPADEDHPYGHGKAEPIAAMIVGISLLVAAVTITLHSIGEILVPHHAPAPFTLIVLAAVIFIKEVLFRFVFKVGSDLGSTAVKGDAWHHRSDAITSAAAFIGISVSLIGGHGYESADDWAALFAAVIIIINAYRISRPAINEIMDASPEPHIKEDLREVASGVKGVRYLEKCFVRKMGFEYYVDLHVTVDAEISVREGHEIAHDVKNAIRKSNPRITDVLIHIEPEGYDDK